MTENEAAVCLVKLLSDYERYCDKIGYSINPLFAKAVARGVMALEQIKGLD